MKKQDKVGVERVRHEQRLLAVESKFRGTSAGNAIAQHRCEDQASCVANGWRIAVASETILTTLSHCIEICPMALPLQSCRTIYDVLQQGFFQRGNDKSDH